jgi:hypothetical protein
LLPFTAVLPLGLPDNNDNLPTFLNSPLISPISLDPKMFSLMPYLVPMLLPPSQTPQHQLIMPHLLLPNNLILPFKP